MSLIDLEIGLDFLGRESFGQGFDCVGCLLVIAKERKDCSQFGSLVLLPVVLSGPLWVRQIDVVIRTALGDWGEGSKRMPLAAFQLRQHDALHDAVDRRNQRYVGW